MKTQLTQQLLRQFSYNALYLNARVPLISLSPRCSRRIRNGKTRASANTHQTRSLFNFTGLSKEPPRVTKYEPGYKKLVELEEKTQMGVRPPPVAEVKASFLEYVRNKITIRQRWIEDNQIQRMIAAHDYMQTEIGKGELEAELSVSELNDVLELLARPTSEKKPQSIVDFARRLFERARAIHQATGDGKTVTEKDTETFQSLTLSYLTILALEGHALESYELARRYWREGTLGVSGPSALIFARGFLLEGRDEDVLDLIKEIQALGLAPDPKLHKSIVHSYVVERKDVDLVKQWFRYPTPDGKRLDTNVTSEILDLCIEKDDFVFGDEVLRKIVETKAESKALLNVTLRYAAAKGKSVDEIGRRIDILMEKPWGMKPDMQTIHGLAVLCMKKFNNPFTAERYINMGLKRGFHPTMETCLLQMEYRLQNKDLAGALNAFEGLRDTKFDGRRSKPLNHLIIALCEAKNTDRESIMSVVDFLNVPHMRLLPATVFALANFHLRRKEVEDFKDLVNSYAQSFGSQDRENLSQVVLNHVLNPKLDIALAFEIWLLIRNACPEIPVETRTTVMKSFFDRGRSDLGMQVFGQMRQSYIREQRPGIDAYAACLQGIGRLYDRANLKTVHSMFKLDMEVELCTKLYNALMIGYTGCGYSDRALDLWEEIASSQEGPTYASLLIALRACERSPYGTTTARAIFERIQKDEVEVTRELYAAYVGALAGHGLVDECKRLIEDAPKEGFEADALMLGTFWNASPGEPQRDKVNDWSRENFPDAYKDLLKAGKKEIRRPLWPDETPGWSYDLEDDDEMVGEMIWDIGHLGRDVDP